MDERVASGARIIAPPPTLYIGSFVLGMTLQVVNPVRLFAVSYTHFVIGGIVLALSGVVARWSFLTMRKLGTTADPRGSSSALAISGPFSFSRNPIYVAMTGLYLGTALLANASGPLVLLPILLGLMHWGVIRREERYLAAQFGNAYLDYTRRVRRWL